MRHLRALLITTALAATACSGGSESVTDAAPDATSAPASSPPTTVAPSSTEAPSETEVVPWEQGQTVLVPAGTVRLPFFGGVQFELEQERVVIQAAPSYAGIRHQGDPGIVEPVVNLLVATETSDGEPITTVEELATALTEHVGAELTPIGEVATGIGPAQGFEYTASEYDPTHREETLAQNRHLLASDVWIWLPFPFGQMWIVDTDQGPLLISAEAFERGPLLDETIATLDLLLETIEFADLD
jgi:hypothetical protein